MYEKTRKTETDWRSETRIMTGRQRLRVDTHAAGILPHPPCRPRCPHCRLAAPELAAPASGRLDPRGEGAPILRVATATDCCATVPSAASGARGVPAHTQAGQGPWQGLCGIRRR